MVDKKCTFPEGTCKEHGLEVERRKNGDLSNRLLLGILITCMGASFVYTAITRNSSDAGDSELRQSMATLTVSISELSNAVAEDKGYMKPLVEQLTELNSILGIK